MDAEQVNFGFSRVDAGAKAARVAGVFSSVAGRYDLMNDAMSWGWHRLWKREAVHLLAPRPGQKVLDLAGGSGDLGSLIAERVGAEGTVVLADINADMLERARARLLDNGYFNRVELVEADGEHLPFADGEFDSAIIGFGLRNFTGPEAGLAQLQRVLKPGGKLVILEFSPLTTGYRAQLYDYYSFNVIPKLGQLLVGDSQSYQYLVESIRVFPNKQKLLELMRAAGFIRVAYRSLAQQAVAVHWGYKP